MARYIDKDEVIDLIEQRQKELCPAGLWGRSFVHGRDRDAYDEYQEIIKAIEAIPEETLESRKSKWVFITKSKIPCCFRCSHMAKEPSRFCPSCGAEMEIEYDPEEGR